ncbi:MAG: NADH-dependent [FeFe] hydrogenase, group A6 [bacterium]
MTKDLIKLWIDEEEIEVEKGTVLIEVAKKAGIDIPTLCYLKEINETGACRICLVELENGKLVASCITPAMQGMKVKTNTKKVRETRKFNLELLLSNHKIDCPSCIRDDDCELRKLAEQMGVRENPFQEGSRIRYKRDESTAALYRDPEKCILCRRCLNVCKGIQSVNAIAADGRGFETSVTPAFYDNLAESPCVLCGQCAAVCPTGAITEREYIEDVFDAIDDPDKIVIVQTAPAVRVALAESFGAEPGTIATGQMVAALRSLGFDSVFDTNFTADLTIMEEGTELINRIKTNKTLPLFTSCSPGWIKFLEHQYPEFLDNLSSCKSPQQMFGALAKSYYAEKNDIPIENLVVVSIMPCTAKKFEANRVEMQGDIDYALSTRELARMIKQSGIDIMNLAKEEYDHLMGVSSGAADIFGTTGGVMEAALRTAYELLTDSELENLDFNELRGMEGIKEAEVEIANLKLKVAVSNGLGNARKLLERIKKGAEYHFVEFMACPGGCLGGGGQPISLAEDVKEKRMAALYQIDKEKEIRKSHENPMIKKIYEDFLKKPGSEKSHQLLHTHYLERGL